MTSYIIRRSLQAVVVAMGVTVIVFILLHVLPGGPARAVLGPRADPERIAAFDAEFGLNKPLPIQFGVWLSQVLRGNLGYSYKLNQSVDALLAENLPRTIALVGMSTLLALIIGVPLGVYQALRRSRADDFVLSVLAFVFYSTPAFFLGLILILAFSVALPILPPSGPSGTQALWSQLPNMVLPVLTLALGIVALFSRYMRSSMIDTLLCDYLTTARAKGVRPSSIVAKHAVRNALLPIITLLGLALPGIIGGALITEAIFNYPGMGYLFWQAAQTEDFPVLTGVTLVVGVSVVVGSLLADVLYAVVDPRVRY